VARTGKPFIPVVDGVRTIDDGPFGRFDSRRCATNPPV